jgi:putative MATE family efflux protein
VREVERHTDEDGAEDTPPAPAALVAPPGEVIAGRSRQEVRKRTDRDIWSLTWPVMLSGVLASSVSLIDLGMIGRLGTDSLAAVGYSTQFFWLSQSVVMAVGIACVALMSRAIGAGRPARARAALAASLVISMAVALVMSALALSFPAPLMRLLDAPEHVVQLAIPYFSLTIGSSVLFAFTFTYESGLRAAKDTRTPMLVVGILTVVKIALNFALIFGLWGFPRLELLGAGLATMLTQAVACGLFAVIALRHRDSRVLRLRRGDLRRARPLMGETVRISLPAVGERVLMNAAIMSYFAVLGQYGPVEVAAYTVGVRLLSFSWIPGMGFSTAAATLVGQSLGADDPDQAARAGWRASRMCVVVSVVVATAFLLGRVPLAEAFTSDTELVNAMQPFMLLLGLSQPFMALHFTLGGALRGAGDTVTPLWTAAVGNWAFRVPFAFLFAKVLGWEVIWVWSVLILDHVARALCMLWAFHRGSWRRNTGLGTRT